MEAHLVYIFLLKFVVRFASMQFSIFWYCPIFSTDQFVSCNSMEVNNPALYIWRDMSGILTINTRKKQIAFHLLFSCSLLPGLTKPK